MFKRLLVLRKPLTSHVITRGFGKPPRCEAHMNELPVPCMPWEPWYSERQSFYNKILAFGAILASGSIFLMFYTESLFLNLLPPNVPGPPSDMVDECEEI